MKMQTLSLRDNKMNVEDFYLTLPNGEKVREDLTDDLNDYEYQMLIEYNKHLEQNGGLSFLNVFSKERVAARQVRRDERRDLKAEKQAAKVDIKRAQARGEIPTAGQQFGGAITDIVKTGVSAFIGGGGAGGEDQQGPGGSKSGGGGGGGFISSLKTPLLIGGGLLAAYFIFKKK
jgi:hypothetical protein